MRACVRACVRACLRASTTCILRLACTHNNLSTTLSPLITPSCSHHPSPLSPPHSLLASVHSVKRVPVCVHCTVLSPGCQLRSSWCTAPVLSPLRQRKAAGPSWVWQREWTTSSD